MPICLNIIFCRENNFHIVEHDQFEEFDKLMERDDINCLKKLNPPKNAKIETKKRERQRTKKEDKKRLCEHQAFSTTLSKIKAERGRSSF